MPPTKKTAKKKSASKLTTAAFIPEQLVPLVIRLRRENVILDSDIVTLKRGQSSLRSQSATSSSHGGRRTLPYAFTEQGVAMLSSVLRSPRAVEVNIAIMRTFVQLRSLMQSNKLLAEKIEKLEEKYDQNFQIVFDAIKQLIAADDNPSKELGFHTI